MSAGRFPSEVRIREVGPRDGLQAEAPLPVGDRVRLIDALAETGLREIEAVSFVSPKAVPAMSEVIDSEGLGAADDDIGALEAAPVSASDEPQADRDRGRAMARAAIVRRLLRMGGTP